MAAPNPRDPLDALQSLIDDVLIQTGKALRASRKDAQGSLSQTPEMMAQPRLPETIRQYHCALDQLESEILRAKSVLLRDLNQVQERKRLFIKPDPQPVEPQSKLPIAIDLDSPSPPATKVDGSMPPAHEAPRPLMAPFPNMSIDPPNDPGQMDIITAATAAGATQPQPAPLPMSLDPPSGNPSNPGGHPGGPLPPPAPDSDLKMDLHHSTAVMPGTSGMNFTDMEFSLAPPPSADHQAPANPNDTAFDLATFAPADGRDDALGMMATNFSSGNINMNVNVNMNMNNSTSNNANANANNAPPPSLAAQHPPSLSNPDAHEKVEDKKGEAADSSKFHDLFGNDSGAADGMDFDFSLGGGEETFSGPDSNNINNNNTGGGAFDFPMDGAGGINTGTTTGGGSGSNSSSDAIINNGGMSSSEFDAIMLGPDLSATLPSGRLD
ncbi:hypothetical protein ESCO_001110 [Escovopsis weberi]|uniref:Uncharacterized protein n=1 Tax=Escovopsis weberi TaxID=150374 RepID=A0A0M8MXX7_ESCWE|nr:hypothetical protein ESCO_001110 [Escovopsis weberi]